MKLLKFFSIIYNLLYAYVYLYCVKFSIDELELSQTTEDVVSNIILIVIFALLLLQTVSTAIRKLLTASGKTSRKSAYAITYDLPPIIGNIVMIYLGNQDYKMFAIAGAIGIACTALVSIITNFKKDSY